MTRFVDEKDFIVDGADFARTDLAVLAFMTAAILRRIVHFALTSLLLVFLRHDQAFRLLDGLVPVKDFDRLLHTSKQLVQLELVVVICKFVHILYLFAGDEASSDALDLYGSCNDFRCHQSPLVFEVHHPVLHLSLRLEHPLFQHKLVPLHFLKKSLLLLVNRVEYPASTTALLRVDRVV